jgi:tripartite-type tricarboxylate transporter receptor subunit TctC
MVYMFEKMSVSWGAALVVMSLGSTPALASGFPAAPVKLMVPQSAGSGGDLVARILSEKMAAALGQSVVVDNKPGANGVLASSLLAKAKPDGYTVMLTGASPIVFNPNLYKKLPYDPAKDFTYIAPVADTPFVLVASKQSGITSFASLVKLAKEKPGRLTFSSAGVGNSTHLATEMMADRTGMKLMHVPYNGSGPALSAVVSGQVDLMFSVVGTALPQIRTGAVKPLLILGADDIADLPNVPSTKKEGIELPPLPAWYAVLGPAGMDPEVAKTLEKAVQEAMRDPGLQQQFKAQYLPELPGTSKDLYNNSMRDLKVWGDLIKRLGISVE